MGFRFRKSINLGGGFRINLSKSGIGYSWGTKGYRVTKTAKGTIRRTTPIPGTGISFVEESGGGKRQGKKQQTTVSSTKKVRLIHKIPKPILIIYFAVVIICIVIIIACKIAPGRDALLSDVPQSVTSTQPSAPKNNTVKIRQAVIDCLEEWYTADEISRVFSGSSRIEVTILSPVMAGDPQPDDWQTVCDTAKTASGSIQQVAEDNELIYGIVYIKDADDTILVTARNGSITYSLYDV